VASQFFGRGEDNGRRAACATSGVEDEAAVALALSAAAPVQAYAVVAWLAGALAIEASGLLLAAIADVSCVIASTKAY